LFYFLLRLAIAMKIRNVAELLRSAFLAIVHNGTVLAFVGTN